MFQVKALETQVRAHQQDLMTAMGPTRSSRREAMAANDNGATQRPVAGLPVSGDRVVHRIKAPRLGSWMIHFGTRLGGASVRTS